MGTIQNCVHDGCLYFLTILDDYSMAILIYLIFEKSEVASILKDYFAMVKN